MPITVGHNLTATTPDDPLYEIRPSHWNDTHAATLSISATEISGLFSNANGVSFGLSANSITASHNGLTTAAQSNHSHGNPTLALTNLSGTTASNSAGLTLSLSAAAPGAGGGVGLSAGTQSVSTGTVAFANSNGITFGMSGSNQITASHNGLTTAAQSNHSHGNPTLALTNLSGTTASNSAGLTLSLSAAAAGGAASLTAYATSNTTQSSSGTFPASSLIFQGNGGVSAGISNGSVVLSGPGTSSLSGTGAVSISVNGSTVSIGVGTVTASATSNTTQGSSGTLNLNGLIFAGAGGASVGISNGSVVISGATGGAGGGAALSAGTQSVSTGTVAFANSNGVTFGMSGSNQITASHNGITSQTNQSVGLYATGNTTQSSTGTQDARSLTFRGEGVASVGVSNGSVVISVANAGGADGFNRLAAGTQTAGTLQTINFADSNGVTFGMSGSSQITASVAGTSSLSNSGALSLSVNGNTISLGVGTVTASATSNTTQGSSGTINLNGLIFHGAGGASVGISNGSVVISGATGGAGGNFSAGVSTGGNTAGATGITGTQLVFVGSNNITLSQTTGANGGTISINAPASSSLSASGALSLSTNGSTISLGVGTVTMSATGNTTQGSSGTVNLNGLIVRGDGVASAGVSNGSIVVSVANAGGADGFNRLAAGTQTAGTLATILFENSNGITFGMSDSTRITASHNGITQQSTQPVAVSGQNGSYAFSTLSFSNANGVSFGTSAGSAITASHNGLTTAAQSDHSHGNPTLALTNLSGTTASNSAGLTLSLSAAAPGAGGGVAMSAGTQSVSTGTVLFENSNGITFGMSGSSRITASHNGITQQSTQPVAVSGQNGSYAFSTLSFSNANGISFGTSAGSAVTASHNALTTAAQSDHSHGNPTLALTNLSGTTASNSAGLTLSLSAAAPGAAAENNWFNLLGANTAGNTTASGSTIGLSGIGVTLSGTNGSVINVSAPASSSLVGAGGISISSNGSTMSVQGITLSGYLENILDRELLAAQIGNTQLFFQPLRLRNNIQFDEIAIPCNWSNASNSSNSGTLTLSFAFYTRNGNSLSFINSTSSSYAVTASGTVGSYSIFGGPREYAIPFTTTMTVGDYYIGFISRTTTGGGAGMTWSNFVASNLNSAYSGRFSSANNATNQWVMGMGSYTAGTTAFPNSVALSQINGSAAANLRPLVYKLVSGDLN